MEILIIQYLTEVQNINISHCYEITNEGLQHLTNSNIVMLIPESDEF